MPRILRFLIPAWVVCALLAGIYFILPGASRRSILQPAPQAPAAPLPLPPSSVGEAIAYNVHMGAMKVGEATFLHLPDEELGGKPAQVMRFVTTLGKFRDTELIYSDPATFLPLKVERDILNFLVQERITETYDQSDFSVTIVKHKGKAPGQTVIRKQTPLNNPILLPQYVRRLPDLSVGMSLRAVFPKKDFVLTLTRIEEIQVPAGRFPAFKFESEPRQIEIWVSADARRLPLKIKGTGLMGYFLVMREYTAPQQQAHPAQEVVAGAPLSAEPK
jgi:hypothetical protein